MRHVRYVQSHMNAMPVNRVIHSLRSPLNPLMADILLTTLAVANIFSRRLSITVLEKYMMNSSSQSNQPILSTPYISEHRSPQVAAFANFAKLVWGWQVCFWFLVPCKTCKTTKTSPMAGGQKPGNLANITQAPLIRFFC